jgi:putative transposase
LVVSKEPPPIEPQGDAGIDVNETNVTVSDTLGKTVVHDTSQVLEIQERYKAIRAKIGQRTYRDKRVSRILYAKYGGRESRRTNQFLHRISKTIVEYAREKRLRIVMENLKGIRRLYRKGNGQGRSFRGRMNSWTFREIQRQVEYKARWAGIPITYVSPRNTSRNCSKCGSQLERLEERQMQCPKCGENWDRDVNASKNIMTKAALVRAARPSTGSNEGESQRPEDVGNPPSRLVEVDLPCTGGDLTEPVNLF